MANWDASPENSDWLHPKQDEPPVTSFSGEFAFLSNFSPYPCRPLWWPEPLPVFPTVEHAFAASKVRFSSSPHDWLETVARILATPTAGQAKRLGRAVALRPDWNVVRVTHMKALLVSKYRYNPQLIDLLLATGSRPLVEGNNWGDFYWGACWVKDGLLRPDSQIWAERGLDRLIGQNHLGWLHMNLRSHFSNES